jgi:hypothetical protein
MIEYNCISFSINPANHINPKNPSNAIYSSQNFTSQAMA